jgi:hypothetical protein
MMAQSRTIDDLGVDISTRWAQDQQLLDVSLIKEAGAIPIQTQIDVTIPAFATEWELLFGGIRRQITWADFFAPPRYHEQKKKLFTFQIIPLLGSEERKEAQLNRVKAHRPEERKEERETAEEREEREGRSYAWEKKREEEEQEREKKILVTLLDSLHHLDRYLVDINSRRTQYQKG